MKPSRSRFAPSLELFTDDGQRYLTRWEVWRRRDRLASLPLCIRWLLDWRVVLHRIYGPDPDRGVHNHPFWGVCFVLRGGYVQVRRHKDGKPVKRWVDYVGWVNVLRLNEFHRIIFVRKNTWTLCVFGPRIRDWGFLRDGVFTPASDAEQTE